MTDLELAAKFREAAGFVRDRGWGHGAAGWYWERGEPVCVEGALLAACGVPRILKNSPDDSSLPLKDLVGERVGYSPLTLWAWNDVRWCARKGEASEILAVFEGLADDLELRHQITVSTPAESQEIPTMLQSREIRTSSQEAILPTLKEAVPA